MVAALRCVRPQIQWYKLAYATQIKSIQLHDSIEGLSQKIVSSTLHCIIHYITYYRCTLYYRWWNVPDGQNRETRHKPCMGLGGLTRYTEGPVWPQLLENAQYVSVCRGPRNFICATLLSMGQDSQHPEASVGGPRTNRRAAIHKTRHEFDRDLGIEITNRDRFKKNFLFNMGQTTRRPPVYRPMCTVPVHRRQITPMDQDHETWPVDHYQNRDWWMRIMKRDRWIRITKLTVDRYHWTWLVDQVNDTWPEDQDHET